MICQVQFIWINLPGALSFSKTLGCSCMGRVLGRKGSFCCPCKAVQLASLAGLPIPQGHGRMYWESSFGLSQSAHIPPGAGQQILQKCVLPLSWQIWGIQEMPGPGSWCHGQVDKVEFSQRFDSMILENFSNLNDSWFCNYQQPSCLKQHSHGHSRVMGTRCTQAFGLMQTVDSGHALKLLEHQI